jgi:hypothetical protein
MKLSKNTVIVFVILIVVAALYRVFPGRPAGFTPQMALALFGGAMIAEKKWAFLLPLTSLFLSDLLYQGLFAAGITDTPGFYEGQVLVYSCFLLVTVFGFLMKNINWKSIVGFSFSGSMIFFLSSNFFVWLGGGGLNRPKTFDGLLMCYGDAVAFYRDYGIIHGFAGNFIIGDLFFTGLLFGTYILAKKSSPSIA